MTATVNILQNFSVTQILREIKVGESKVSKNYLGFDESLHFMKAEMYRNKKLRVSNCKNDRF